VKTWSYTAPRETWTPVEDGVADAVGVADPVLEPASRAAWSVDEKRGYSERGDSNSDTFLFPRAISQPCQMIKMFF